MALAAHIIQAIRCGPTPKMRDWRKIKRLTRAEMVIGFIETMCLTPEGENVGRPIILDPFQRAFIYSIFDSKTKIKLAILSIGRKNGKTALIAAILLVYVVGPEARLNSQICSGAMSKEQASIVFKLAVKMINLNPELSKLIRIMPSVKKLIGLPMNTEYSALAADGSRAMGYSPFLAILDEVGQIRSSSSEFVEAITSAQGAYDSALVIAISTQSPSDSAMLSLWMDDAELNQPKDTVVHLYTSDPDLPMDDPTHWKNSNPALGKFRSRQDMSDQITKAVRMPSVESSVRNLILNQRVAISSVFINPSTWKLNAGKPDLNAFLKYPVHIGLDLSKRTDLTAAVACCADDDGIVHVIPFVFAPEVGVVDRSTRDKAPYSDWVRDGFMFLTPGATVDYNWVCEFIDIKTVGWTIASIEFDAWRIQDFKRAAAATGLHDRVELFSDVGQGYKSFSPRLEAIEAALLSGKIRHGGHPLLNMSAANAIVTSDPAGSRKIDKSKTTLRIDPLVALVMAIYPCTEGKEEEIDVSGWI